MIPSQTTHFNDDQRPRHGEGIGNHKTSRKPMEAKKRNTFPTIKRSP